MIYENLLFISGQIAYDPKTKGVIKGTFEYETDAALRNLKGIIEEAGSSLDRILKVTVFLTDISEPIRFGAVTATFAMDDPASVPALTEALQEEESLRVKNRIAQGLADRGWSIPSELRAVYEGALPPDFELAGDVVRRIR